MFSNIPQKYNCQQLNGFNIFLFDPNLKRYFELINLKQISETLYLILA
jgi:hypothetical protein